MRNVILVQPGQLGIENLRPGWRKRIQSKGKGKLKRPIPVGLMQLFVNIKDAFFIDNHIEQLTTGELAAYCLDCVGEDGVVGFGGTCFEWRQAADVSQKLRTHNITTVYGGSNAKARPNKHKKYFDYVFNTGEEFLTYLGLEPSLPIWPTHNNIPNRANYTSNAIFSGYGCTFNCRFCAAKYIGKRQIYFRPINDVIAELKELNQTQITFREDNFTINKPRLTTFCCELSKLGIKWSCQARISGLDIETIKMMVASGCNMVSCGFESGNDTTLRAINKGHTVDDMRRVVGNLNKYGLPYTGGFIAGLPNEGEKEIVNTIKFIAEIKSPISHIAKKPIQFIGLPISELYFEVQEKNLVEYDWNDGEVLFCGTEKLTCNEVEDILCN